MHLCLIMDNPETPHHPVIGEALRRLGQTHEVRLLDVRNLSSAEALAREQQHPRADLYLLKSHAPQALDVARVLEEQGALVVNSWASSLACQDRAQMAARMQEHHLPWPATRSYPSLKGLLEQESVLAATTFPVILKSYYSHRGDLVAKVNDRAALETLGGEWGQEPIVVQEFAASDGWDIKLWVIDERVFAARRRTPLEPNASKQDIPISDEELPDEWRRIALEIGRVFNLRLYGLDLIVTGRGPVVIDVNSFPGFRGVPGAESALVALVERLAGEREARV
jgi:ribosomal protein S6--L-glutamate ligase